ncbi:hypothetical protein [Polaromonas sp. AER18D-145]|uniref:hypothetical protein n=1 Tax=Polaromonas sp. AER18D-145 TaxID=1977060 RepID=UPI001143CF2F|nr:hypothetical protein [Polaromonas sp. AER18D-145]
MGDPTTMAMMAMAASAGGAVLQADAADEAANKQQNILTAGEEENQRINKAGEERVNDFAKDVFDPTKRDERYEDGAAKREDSLVSALMSTTPNAGATGNVSTDYLTGNSASQAAGMGEAQKRAKLMARSGGGGLMYGAEAMMGGDLSSDLAGLAQKTRRNSIYTQNAAGRVRNEGSLAGGLLQGVGAAGMKMGGT